MPQCPVCQSEISDDFGLIDCPQCKTPLFVQMDGSVQSMGSGGEVSNAGYEEPAQDNIADVLVDEALLPAEDLISAEAPSEEPMMELSEEPVTEDFGQSPSEEVALEPEAPVEEALAEEAPVEEAPAESSVDDIDAFLDDDPIPSPVVPVTPISDMSQLANTTETDAQTGSIRYNIAIAGIDTAEIRKEFRELLSDRRFLFDVDAVLKSIRSGRVRMQNVTAVKAILLIQRLRGLPVNVQWEQHVVHTD